MRTTDIIAGIATVAIVIFAIITMTLGVVEAESDNKYCGEIFPSPIKETSTHMNNWAETKNVELSYVRCCRNLWENHEKITECKIFKKEEQE